MITEGHQEFRTAFLVRRKAARLAAVSAPSDTQDAAPTLRAVVNHVRGEGHCLYESLKVIAGNSVDSAQDLCRRVLDDVLLHPERATGLGMSASEHWLERVCLVIGIVEAGSHQGSTICSRRAVRWCV